jgi:putative ABC transport system permease protein
VNLTAMLVGVGTLRAYPLRTFLSTLGVVIGVAALVAILALGDGLEAFSREQLATTTDVQTILVDSRTTELQNGVRVRLGDVVSLTPARAESLGADLGDLAAVAVFLTGSAWARVPGDTSSLAVLVSGSTPALLRVGNVTLVTGRFLEAADLTGETRVAVVTPDLARRLAPAGDVSQSLGRPLAIDSTLYTVVGIVRAPGSAPRAYLPLGVTLLARLGENGRQAPTAVIRARRVEDVESVRARVERWLTRYGNVESRFSVQSARNRARQARRGIQVFKLAMGSITGISLLVGGIGIMNILLASVAERTREIGVRKAAGARARDILFQFLAESVAISGLGAFAGVVLGLGGAYAITAAIRRVSEASLRAGYSWTSVGVGAGLALVVGIVFGTYPALRAARLPPIEAIRHE